MATDHLPYLPFHNYSKPSCGSFKMLSFINQDLTDSSSKCWDILWELLPCVIPFWFRFKYNILPVVVGKERDTWRQNIADVISTKKKKKKKHYCEELWSPAKYPEKAGAWEHYVNNPIKRCTCTHILNFFNKSSMGF